MGLTVFSLIGFDRDVTDEFFENRTNEMRK